MYEDDFCEEVPPKKSNISSWFEESIQDNQVTISLTEEEEVNLACLESNIAKVSGQCNKMMVELQRLHIEEPLRVILADLIEAVTTTNKVQEGLSARVRANTTLTKKLINLTVTLPLPLPLLPLLRSKKVKILRKAIAGKNFPAVCLPHRQMTEVSFPDPVAP